jgi:hypothetical protein
MAGSHGSSLREIQSVEVILTRFGYQGLYFFSGSCVRPNSTRWTRSVLEIWERTLNVRGPSPIDFYEPEAVAIILNTCIR